VQTDWDPGELIGAWTLVEGNWDLIANKAGVTRLGFAVMLKFYEIEGRFPAYPEEVPPAAVRYLGSVVKVDPALFANADFHTANSTLPAAPWHARCRRIRPGRRLWAVPGTHPLWRRSNCHIAADRPMRAWPVAGERCPETAMIVMSIPSCRHFLSASLDPQFRTRIDNVRGDRPRTAILTSASPDPRRA